MTICTILVTIIAGFDILLDVSIPACGEFATGKTGTLVAVHLPVVAFLIAGKNVSIATSWNETCSWAEIRVVAVAIVALLFSFDDSISTKRINHAARVRGCRDQGRRCYRNGV